MAGLNMKVLLQLQAKEFNKGIGQVKRGLTDLRNTFRNVAGVLVGGFGLSKAVSAIKDTAVQLSVAEATLENVSENVLEYAENLSFLKKISNDYGQEMKNIIQGFAQFRAAAKSSNLSLEQQRDIYAALTRAAGAFHLTADQSNNMMLAITQMMSKGKVASEELRRQLGNVLPGAFIRMTEAAYRAGVITSNSTAEMETAMKKGLVTAEAVLPEFAKIMNEMTEHANFDSLQSSLNRLQNTWTTFVKSIGTESSYKKVIDGLNNGLTSVIGNLSNIRGWIIGIITAFLSYKIFEKIVSGVALIDGRSKAYFKGLENDLKIVEKEIDTIAKKSQFNQIKQTGKAGFIFRDDEWDKLKDLGTYGTELFEESQKLNKQWLRLYETNKKLGKNSWCAVHAQRYEILKKQTKEVDKALKDFSRTTMSFGTLATRALQGVLTIMKNIWAMFKTQVIIAAVSAVLGYLTKIVTKSKELKAEAERIANIVSDYEKAAKQESLVEEESSIIMRRNLSIIQDSTKSEEERKAALSKINELLGLENDKAFTIQNVYDSTGNIINNDILPAIDKWIKKTKALGQYQSDISLLQERKAKVVELNGKLDTLGDAYEKKTGEGLWGYIKRDGSNYSGQYGLSGTSHNAPNTKWIKENVMPVIAEIKQHQEVIRMLENDMSVLEKDLADLGVELNGNNNGNTTTNNKETVVDKLKENIDKYKEAVKEIENQYKNGALSAEEYGDEMAKATDKYWKQIAAFGDLDEQLKKLGKDAVDTIEQLKKDFANVKLAEAIEAELKEADKAFEKEMEDMIDKEQKYFDKVMELWDEPMPEMGKRDTFFDYKKKGSEIFGDEADVADDYVKALEDRKKLFLDLMKINGGLAKSEQEEFNALLRLLEKAKASASTLRSKANVQEWIEDVKELKDKYDDLTYDNFKDFSGTFDKMSSSTHRLAEAFATLADTELAQETQDFFNKLDAGISIVNELISVWEMMRGLIEGLKKSQEAYAALQKAVSASEAINTAQKLGLLKAEEAAEMKSATATQGAEIAKQAAIAGTTTALASEAVAGAASSQASIPYIGPILAAAAVAGIVGLLAANMGKFARGGIVGGNSTQGDNNIIRANSGELILNKAQQGTLYKAIASGNLGGNGGEWRVRGTDLIKVINNTQNKIKG